MILNNNKAFLVIFFLLKLAINKPTINIIYNSLDIDSQFFIEISLGNAIVHDQIFDLVDINMIPGGMCNESKYEEPDKYIFKCPGGKMEN